MFKGFLFQHKKIVAINIIFLSLVVSFILAVEKNSIKHDSISVPATSQPLVESNVSSIPIGEMRLIIPRINVIAPVEIVGKTTTGRMAVPKNLEDVGLYRYGSTPGEPGNAVIAGHLDDGKGNPGVFYNIKDVKVNDEIVFQDKKGNRITFVVYSTQVLDYKDPALDLLQEIFGTSTAARLNLITCEGEWIPEKKTYSGRLVVFAEKKL